jgi:hypothetical protein
MLMLAPRLLESGEGVELAPAFGAATLPWPDTQTVATPWGPLVIAAAEEGGGIRLTFEAPADFTVQVKGAGGVVEARSKGTVLLPGQSG